MLLGEEEVVPVGEELPLGREPLLGVGTVRPGDEVPVGVVPLLENRVQMLVCTWGLYAWCGAEGPDALHFDRRGGRMRRADDSGPATGGGHAWVPRRRVGLIGF